MILSSPTIQGDYHQINTSPSSIYQTLIFQQNSTSNFTNAQTEQENQHYQDQ
jgi:hypothetical protein